MIAAICPYCKAQHWDSEHLYYHIGEKHRKEEEDKKKEKEYKKQQEKGVVMKKKNIVNKIYNIILYVFSYFNK